MQDNDRIEERVIISKGLKSARKEKKMTQKQLSDASGIELRTILRMESGKQWYSIKYLLQYCNTVGLQIILVNQ